MKIDVLGVKISSDSRQGILEQVETRLDSGESTFIVTPYSESLVAAQKDIEFRNVLNSADFAIPDGAGVLFAAKFLSTSSSPDEGRSKRRGLERIPGREFFWDLCALAENRRESIFLLGGFGDTPQIVAQKLRKRFPRLKIVGAHAPSFSKEGERGSSIIELINQSNTDFLFVALGPIAQEKWIYRNLPNLRIKLAMGVGGTFDYVAGKRPLPPQFLAFHGLEWLWRLLTQPWRAWRITKGVLGLIWCTFDARIKR